MINASYLRYLLLQSQMMSVKLYYFRYIQISMNNYAYVLNALFWYDNMYYFLNSKIN